MYLVDLDGQDVRAFGQENRVDTGRVKRRLVRPPHRDQGLGGVRHGPGGHVAPEDLEPVEIDHRAVVPEHVEVQRRVE